MRKTQARGRSHQKVLKLVAQASGLCETDMEPSLQISRRNLPHWELAGSTYFLTWRTVQGVQLLPEHRQIAMSAIRYWDQRKWHLYCAVVMPDHVHALARPLPIDIAEPNRVASLSQLIHSIKSFSAHEINACLQRRGAVWQDERFDRIVRDQDEFVEKWVYIRNNPVKAGLAKTSEEYHWLYEAAVF